MARFWKKIRLPLTIFVLFAATLFMARLFSGPEDTWVRNDRGGWVRHGNPSAPMPAADFRPPVAERMLPWVFLGSFGVPLFFLRRHRQVNRLMYETAVRDIRFLGYLSTALTVFGVLSGFATAAGFVAAYDASARIQDLFTYAFLAGISGLCILLGVLFFVLGRNINDHFQLERGRRELLDLLQTRGGA